MKADLLLVIHFHQPVGNFDGIFQRVYDRCYKPFLDIVSQFPAVKVNIHVSGCLFEWLESHQPGLLKSLKKLVKRKQVELIGGGFYEPVLSIIPQRDRLGQLDMMRRFIKAHFGTEPKGAWLAERIWEPELISPLAAAGVKYVVLDDTHFLYAGLKKDETHGFFISEDNGGQIYIFPSDKTLRYAIPFGEPERPVSYMKAVAEKNGDALFTYGDDAEKFGEWPGTHKWVYEDKWLVSFLTALSENKSWLSTITLSECVSKRKPLGRIYLPTASYEEMLQWALPAESGVALEKIKEEIKKEGKEEAYSPFIRGGFFRNFLYKYNEANQMHKKMLYVSNLLESCGKGGSAPKDKALQAKEELYKGQCNCAYWHGIFGGLYLYHLRKAVYEHLLKAEKLCKDMMKDKKLKPEVFDFDIDGSDEVIMENKDLWLCVKPSAGGCITELDIKNRFVNFLNVLTRRRESYHGHIAKKLASDEGGHVSIHEKVKPAGDLASKLIYDIYQKAMLIDHFLEPGTALDDFEKCIYKEEGDFVNAPYDFQIKDDKSGLKLTMERKGEAYGAAVGLRKELLLRKSSLRVKYVITNLGRARKRFLFGLEVAFIMPEANSPAHTYIFNKKDSGSQPIDSRGVTEKLRQLEITDGGNTAAVMLLFSKQCTLWRFPIMTISQSEQTYEENYQGSVILPTWNLVIDSNDNAELYIDICFS